jgi:hypothetical protein
MITSNIQTCRRAGIAAFCAAFVACGGNSSRTSDSSAANGTVASTDSAASATSGTTMIRGTVASVSTTSLGVQTDTGTTNVQLTQPLRVYERQPARMEDIAPNTFVGVTTVKQPDGSNRATEIHIFPAELRGLGEGSRPMAPAASGSGGGSTPSTMTNGAASAPPSGSTMTNGNASSQGSTLDVQYAGGSIKATVPANTPITKLVATSKPLAAGDRVVVVAMKQADGSLASNRVVLAR